MSFNVSPKAGPSLTPSTSQGGQDGKARALAKLNAAMEQNASRANPVPNPTQISPEELSAVTSQVSEPATESPTSESSSAPAVTKAPEEPLSSQYAQLARREKAIRAKALEIKAQEAAFKQREDALKAKEADYSQNYIQKSRFTEDPLSVLNEAGVNYDDLTNRILNQPRIEDAALAGELKNLRDEIKALKGEQEQSKKSYEENQTNAYKQAVDTIRRDVAALVKTNPDFEVVHATGSVGDVVDLIERTFKEGLSDEYPAGTVLDIEVAAKMVEDHLVEEALKIARTKKITQKLQPATPAAAKPAQQQPAKTLTNAMGANRPLSAKERALLAFEGKLNKS